MEKLGLTSKLKGFNNNNNSDDILRIDKLKSVKVEKIKIEKLVPYENHLFKLYDGDRLKDMIESVKELLDNACEIWLKMIAKVFI